MPPISQDPAERVTRAPDAHEFARRATDQLVGVLGASVAYVGAVRDDKLTTIACSGAAGGVAAVERLAGEVLDDGQAVLRIGIDVLGMGSLAAVPIEFKARSIGVLLVLAEAADGLDHRDLATLELLAPSLGTAVAQAARGNLLYSMFEAVAVGILHVDGLGRVLNANRRAEEMFGRGQRELRGVLFADVLISGDLAGPGALHGELIGGTVDHHEFEQHYAHGDGSVFWGHTHVSRVAGVGVMPPTAVVTILDITERRRADDALRAGRDRLEEIIRIQHDIAAVGSDPDQVLAMIAERTVALTAADGSIVSLVDGDDLVVAAAAGAVGRIVGHRRSHQGTIAEHAFAQGHALLVEDLATDPRVGVNLDPHATPEEDGAKSLICVPLIHAGAPVAAINVVRAAGSECFTDADLQILELVAVVLASAVSRAAESSARRQQVEALARFEATYSSAPVGMTMIALDGTILDLNPAMRTMLGAEGEELAERPIASLAHPDDAAEMVAQLRRIESEDIDTVRLEHRLVRIDSEFVWVDAAWSVVRDADGERSFAIGTVQDITQRKAAEAVLLAQSEINAYHSLHDQLTGLPNRTLLRDRAALALDAARRSGNQLAVLVLDLDGFKQVNDTLGHAGGDEVLIELSRRLEKVLRSTDTAARLGGDEFALLLPDVQIAQDVLPIIERIRGLFLAPLDARGETVGISVSIGVAVFPAGGGTLDELLHAADLAMYEAKRSQAGYAFAAAA